MKCELCNSGPRERKQKLCQPCIEAVVRLWNIANQAGYSIASVATALGESVQTGSSETASQPHALR